MSVLRLCGLVVAAALMWLVIRSRSRHPTTALDNLLLGVVAALLAVSLFPSVVSVPEALLSLDKSGHGRLLTLLVLSSLALWITLVLVRERRIAEAHGTKTLIDALQVDLFALRHDRPVAPVAVIIPAFNEGPSIAEVVRAIPSSVHGLETTPIVVSDGSRDDTVANATAAGAVVLALSQNRGGGAAIRLGYAFAARQGARIIVTMDGDGQHDPGDLPKLVAPIANHTADMTVGSRGLGAYVASRGLRALGLRLFNRVLGLLLQMPVTDCSSGYRAFNAETVSLSGTYEDQYHAAETLIRLRRSGVRIVEVGVTMKGRAFGESKKGKDLIYGYRFARSILRHWLRG